MKINLRTKTETNDSHDNVLGILEILHLHLMMFLGPVMQLKIHLLVSRDKLTNSASISHQERTWSTYETAYTNVF